MAAQLLNAVILQIQAMSLLFLPVSRLQAKYKGCLGKREYKKKREAGMGSGIGDSLLRAMLPSRSCSFGRSRIHVAADSTRSFPAGLWVLGSRAGDSCMKSIHRGLCSSSHHVMLLVPPRHQLWEQLCSGSTLCCACGVVLGC